MKTLTRKVGKIKDTVTDLLYTTGNVISMKA
jgi:hypothetical protein